MTPLLHFSSKLTILTASSSRNPPGLILSMLNKIQWSALRSAASDLSLTELDAINEITEEVRQDDVILRKVHHVLFEVHLIEGFLVCPETSRKFPVRDGIPNMLLHEDEV